MKKIAYLLLPAILFILSLPALATGYEYNWDLNDNEAFALGGGLIIGLIILWIVLMAIGIFFFVFWILMLIDVNKREFAEKNTWLIILIVSFFIGLSWLAALVYYFAIKRESKKQTTVKVEENIEKN